MSNEADYKLIISPAAEADLVSLASYTRRMHGREQEGRYLSQIDKRIQSLKRFPNLGTLRPDIHPLVRSITIEKHLIVYSVQYDQVTIQRVFGPGQELTKSRTKEIRSLSRKKQRARDIDR